MTKIGISLLYCCLVSIALGLLASPASAKNKANITDLRIERVDGTLKVGFAIENCFTPKMEEAIRSGVPTTFRIRILLEQPGVPLLRNRLLDLSLEHTIKYDSLKGEYRVQLPECHPERVQTTSNFDEAKYWMSHVTDMTLLPLWRLQKERSYDLRVKAELSKIRLPLFFRYVFFFVSLWDFDTDWYKASVSM